MFDDADGNIRSSYLELCAHLNMDRDAVEEAWQNYDTNRRNYTLEGDQLHWLCCALHVACRKSVPSVGRPESSVEGNCVSLTNLLRQGNLSLTQFLSKAKKWAEMSKLPPEFRGQIDRLGRNFAVSMVIFKKFQPIFLSMFQDPSDEESPKPVPRSRKQRTVPCTPAKVFDFGWSFFVCVKGGLRDVADDLVSSYHLLLACCDLLFANALLSLRKDLLNPTFSGLPKDFIEKDYEPPVEAPCIIDILCEEHDGIPLEAKLIKEYSWKQHLTQLFEDRVLKGDPVTFTGLLDPNNFDANYKAVIKAYKEYVLRAGDFDERVFLEDEENSGLGTSGGGGNGLGDFTEKMQAQRNRTQKLGPIQHLVPLTPLTGRKYLTGKESASITPVSTATQSVSRLQSLLCGRQAAPSEALIAIFKSVAKNPQAQIEERIAEMGRQFCRHHTQSQNNDDAASGSTSKSNQQRAGSIDFAKRRVQFAERLYYKLLENILIGEKKKKPSLDLSVLLEHQVFHETLFACCLEIVIYSYNSQRTFPWILDVLGIEPYYFYKVIELIVLAEDQLSRDMVKHLNFIEEQILESMAWKSDSPVWDAIADSGLPVPSCEDVSLPGQISTDSPNGTVEPTSMYTASSSPLPNPMIRRLAMGTVNDRPALKHMLHQSPGSSALERFHSPLPPGQARKRLFVDSLPPSSTTLPSTTSSSVMSSAATSSSSISNTSNAAPANVMVKPGQSLLQSTAAKAVAINIQTIQGENGERYIPISYMPSPGSVIIQAHHAVGTPVQTPAVQTGSVAVKTGQPPAKTTSSTPAANSERRPRRTGSLGLFFRKFYHLAWVRMQELCKDLHIEENDLRRKIWTFFEYTIINHTDLMCDRHVDQILMCSVYVICRVTKNEKSFTDIMGCYRKQPQCASHIYRSVLLSSSRKQLKKGDASSVDKENQGKGSAVEDRGDLIRFYNTVYVLRVQSFAHRFSGDSVSKDNLTLSPLPMARSQAIAQQQGNPNGGSSLPSSPCRRVSEHHSVYIRSLERPVAPVTPGTAGTQFPQSPQNAQPLSYSFSRSPAKDLRAINLMIRLDAARGNPLGDTAVSNIPGSLTRVRRIGKRLLADDPSNPNGSEGNGEADVSEGSDGSKPSPPKQAHMSEPPIVARKIQDMMGDRMGQAQE
ncbi:retinoblastoma-like protein 1 isoform X1 [Ischnura elegans]|uniref:retinoblastoma-like protein 1 isoform X1 n=1 Tax=Ischnura elegans TaxID=197161 RepID=UPI001ED89C33|nr:retinoblastoma-like protein 1 isoform X1 [Ischnura elegans]